MASIILEAQSFVLVWDFIQQVVLPFSEVIVEIGSKFVISTKCDAWII